MSYKYIFFTCLHTGLIFIVQNKKCIKTLTIQQNFLDTLLSLNDLKINKTTFYFCKGPGSYTGIRQTLSFALGLKYGAQVKGIQPIIRTFTLFDFITYITGKPNIFINGFFKYNPKNQENVTNSDYKLNNQQDLKGFAKINNKFIYISNSTDLHNEPSKYGIKDKQSLLLVKNPYKYINCKNTIKFVSNFNNFSNNLEPVYINPVNITKPKNA